MRAGRLSGDGRPLAASAPCEALPGCLRTEFGARCGSWVASPGSGSAARFHVSLAFSAISVMWWSYHSSQDASSAFVQEQLQKAPGRTQTKRGSRESAHSQPAPRLSSTEPRPGGWPFFLLHTWPSQLLSAGEHRVVLLICILQVLQVLAQHLAPAVSSHLKSMPEFLFSHHKNWGSPSEDSGLSPCVQPWFLPRADPPCLVGGSSQAVAHSPPHL